MIDLNPNRVPDVITVQTEDAWHRLDQQAEHWTGPGGIEVVTTPVGGKTSIKLRSSSTPVCRIHLRWKGQLGGDVLILNDHWERGYGDLEWRGIVPERILPWYFLVTDEDRSTHGFGVMTQPNAMCAWRVDQSGVSLICDVRCGAMGVQLNGRTLDVASIVTRPGVQGETPFVAAREFAKVMCPNPRLADHVVYGSNNWYYAYGHSSHEQIVTDTKLLMEDAPSSANRPYMVIDSGWQTSIEVMGGCGGGPWEHGNAKFPDMAGLASQMKALGARPGIWLRPLAVDPSVPVERTLLLPVERAVDWSAKAPVLDPSIPEVVQRVENDFARLRGWGYELIKHDWTCCDMFGRWGFDLKLEMTNDGWAYNDRTRTTAEIMLDLFRAIRRGAGDAVVIGCNTVSHLSAGFWELQRTGDDTSGRDWERTRKMGINTLAFRMHQHNTFYGHDADCAAITRDHPWPLAKKWLDVLATSGTPLFISAAPEAVGPEQRHQRTPGLAADHLPAAMAHRRPDGHLRFPRPRRDRYLELFATDRAPINTDSIWVCNYICVNRCPIGGKNLWLLLRALRASVVKHTPARRDALAFAPQTSKLPRIFCEELNHRCHDVPTSTRS
jgi:alpha-galactosidase